MLSNMMSSFTKDQVLPSTLTSKRQVTITPPSPFSFGVYAKPFRVISSPISAITGSEAAFINPGVSGVAPASSLTYTLSINRANPLSTGHANDSRILTRRALVVVSGTCTIRLYPIVVSRAICSHEPSSFNASIVKAATRWPSGIYSWI